MSVVTINCVVFACALMPWQTQTIQGTDINKVTRSSPAPSNFHVVHPPCARQVMRRAPRPPLSKTTISDNSAMPRLMVSHGSCFRPEKQNAAPHFLSYPLRAPARRGNAVIAATPAVDATQPPISIFTKQLATTGANAPVVNRREFFSRM
jgi:hypothetical protein